MDLQAYQDFLVEYSDSYGLPPSLSVQTVRLGLMGESGEVIEVLKKHLRDGVTDITALKAELGDVLVSFFLILKEVGIPLSEVDVEYIDTTSPTDILVSARKLYRAIDTFLTDTPPSRSREAMFSIKCMAALYDSKLDTSPSRAREVMFAIKRIANLYEIGFEDIVRYNWNKLSKRLVEGKQRGSGDNR